MKPEQITKENYLAIHKDMRDSWEVSVNYRAEKYHSGLIDSLCFDNIDFYYTKPRKAV